MVWKTVNNADAGDATHFGGNDRDKISNLFNGVLDVDSVDINSSFTFRDDKLAFRNPANTFSYVLQTGAITTADRNISLPVLTADDTFVFLNLAQTIDAKTLTNFAYLESDATNVPSTGALRLGNAERISWRNNGNTDDVYIDVDIADDINFYFDSILKYYFTNNGADWGNGYLNNVLYIGSAATNPGTSGAVRLGDGEEITWRNTADDNESHLRFNDETFRILNANVIEYSFTATQFDFNSNSGINVVLDDFTNTIHADTIHKQVRNISGSTITQYSLVYISGYDNANDVPTITLADASNASTMPAIGMVTADISNNTNGDVTIMGRLVGATTTGMTEGDTLYVSETTGAFTNVKPTTATAQLQNVGFVEKVGGVGVGIVKIVSIGRTNDVPNQLIRDLDAGDNIISNFKNIQFNASGTTADTAYSIHSKSNAFEFNVPTGGYFLWTTNGSPTMAINLVANKFDLLALDLINFNYIESNATNPSSSGTIRLGSTETIEWRNAGNTADLAFFLNGSDEFEFESTINVTTGTVQENGVDISPIGNHDIYLDAGAIIPVDSGAFATRIVDTGVDQKAFAYVPFVAGSVTFATAKIVLPRTYGLGTITAVIEWTSATEGAGTVEWDISGCAIGDGEDMSTVAYGTAITSTDTQTTINQVQTSPRTTAITLGNTPADGNVIFLKIQRDGTTDTFTEDAQLLGIWIEITTDTAVSA